MPTRANRRNRKAKGVAANKAIASTLNTVPVGERHMTLQDLMADLATPDNDYWRKLISDLKTALPEHGELFDNCTKFVNGDFPPAIVCVGLHIKINDLAIDIPAQRPALQLLSEHLEALLNSALGDVELDIEDTPERQILDSFANLLADADADDDNDDGSMPSDDEEPFDYREGELANGGDAAPTGEWDDPHGTWTPSVNAEGW